MTTVGEAVELDFFVNKTFYLSGVDMVSEGDANGIMFCLNGITYRAMEDPEDGYRSCLGGIGVVGDVIKNAFAPQPVIGTARKYDDDTVVFINPVTKLAVLEIGTDNMDAYYPSFVAWFDPKSLGEV